MNFELITPEQIMDVVTEGLRTNEERCRYILYTKPYVVPGNNEIIDSEKAQELNVKILNIPNSGGTVVTSSGDIGLGILSSMEKANRFAESFMTYLNLILSNRNFNISRNGNDLILNDYKVASYGSKSCGLMTFAIIQISMNVDMHKIEELCTKPMKKIPKGLSEFGITSEEMLQWVENWVQNFS